MNIEKLNELVVFARNWFIEHNVEMPKSAAAWQKCSVDRGEIPPGCTTGSLRRLGTTTKWFIESILGKDNPTSINKIDMDYGALGFNLLDYTWCKGHKSCSLECIQCGHTEVIDYGTLARMRERGDKYCRICRNAGGKPKPLHVYDRLGFKAIAYDSRRVTLVHDTCGKSITRAAASLYDGNIPVCDHCLNISDTGIKGRFGAKTTHNGIIFPSKIEAEVFAQLTKLAKEFNFSIRRQVPYKELFANINTKHTADFYIPEYGVIVEAGGVNTQKYIETREWKLSLSNKVCFISKSYQVDDIVRPLLKTRG